MLIRQMLIRQLGSCCYSLPSKQLQCWAHAPPVCGVTVASPSPVALGRTQRVVKSRRSIGAGLDGEEISLLGMWHSLSCHVEAPGWHLEKA